MTSKTSTTGGRIGKNSLMDSKDSIGAPRLISRSSLTLKNDRDVNNSALMGGSNILTFEQLGKLSEQKGRHVGQSMMEPLLQPIWKMVVEVIPVWWSPNAIILTGLIFHGITTFILLGYCPDARGEAPKWVYYLCALGLTTFFILDAIDERQAQKTKCHPALRELFNHGCDAFANAFLVLGACTAIKLGSHPRIMFLEFFSMLFTFYSVHWQTYCSGIISFQYLDSMEIQFSIILLYLLTGIFGPGIWDVEILWCPVKFMPVFISLAIGYFCCLGRLSYILIQGGVGKNGSTVADTSVLSPLVPVCVLLFIGYWVSSNSQSHILQRHPYLFLAYLGVPLIKLGIKIVVSHMSRSEMVLLDDVLYIPGVGAILQASMVGWFGDYSLLWLCFVCSSLALLWYCFRICREMCAYLDICCFKVQLSPGDSHIPQATT